MGSRRVRPSSAFQLDRVNARRSSTRFANDLSALRDDPSSFPILITKQQNICCPHLQVNHGAQLASFFLMKRARFRNQIATKRMLYSQPHQGSTPRLAYPFLLRGSSTRLFIQYQHDVLINREPSANTQLRYSRDLSANINHRLLTIICKPNIRNRGASRFVRESTNGSFFSAKNKLFAGSRTSPLAAYISASVVLRYTIARHSAEQTSLHLGVGEYPNFVVVYDQQIHSSSDRASHLQTYTTTNLVDHKN